MHLKNNCSFLFSEYISFPWFISINIGLIVLFNLWFMKNRGEVKLNKAGIVLVDVGAAANVVQRLFTGCVADYFPFFNLLYFNVWDILIVSGILILFGDTLYEQKRIIDRG